MSISFFVAAAFCPIIGILTDKIGKRVLLIVLSCVCITIFHVVCLMTPDSYQPIYPIFFLVFLGLGYSIYVTVYWAAISYIVEPRFYGTAFGATYALSNLGLVIFPLLVGKLIDNTNLQEGYFWVSFTLAIVAAFGAVTGVIVYFIDLKKGGILNSVHPDVAKLKYDAQVKKAHLLEEMEASVN